MIYSNIHKGTFISRPNRFIAEVDIDGKTEICHVKNTGRCKELLVPGATVYANYADSPLRSPKYDLVAVKKGALMINMDSQAPNCAFCEYKDMMIWGKKGQSQKFSGYKWRNTGFPPITEQKS